MSSSFVVEPQESGCKKDDTLIIVVNDDGTISVDQETLQNLIMNQTDANVSVVRVGQGDGDAANGDLTLTVDPPSFAPPEAGITAPSVTDHHGLVDPFMEMDPEQLEKLETALQSEQAKQILGENVTAMLDMLTVEEEQKSIKYCIELDHCYTSRSSPADPEPSDPLPIAHSPDIDDFEYKHSTLSHQTSPMLAPAAANVGDSATPVSRSKLPGRPMRTVISRGRKVSTPSTPQTPTTAKTVNAGTATPRNANAPQQTPNKGTPSGRLADQAEDAEATSSSESSESEAPSDDGDSDFGPRGPRRGGVRARGGRKGLTTRGGSMTATRRRGANKHMDMDQVRRLDMEMAAAVDAMKSPDKPERADRFNPVKAKKQLKTLGGRKKDDPSPGRGVAPVNESPPAVPEKPLQTTNQVKANLINANMIKGDMILTKPGQARNNQKLMFVQKNVMVKANEMRNLGAKKPSIILNKGGKTMPLQIQTKLGTSEAGKLVSVGGRVVTQPVQSPQTTQPTTPTTLEPSVCSPAVALPVQQELSELESLQQQQHLEQEQQREQQEQQQQREQQELQQQQQRELQQQQLQKQEQQRQKSQLLLLEQQQLQKQLQHQQQQQQQQQEQEQEVQRQQQEHQRQQQTLQSAKPAVVEALPIKAKISELKKEKKKSESELVPKTEESAKSGEIKTPDTFKKHLKKDPRKTPAVSVDALGPALFSTPDIIRRVGSGAEAKGPDVPETPTSTPVSTDSDSTSGAATASSAQESDIYSPTIRSKSQEENWNIAAQPLQPERLSTDMETQEKASIGSSDSLHQVNCDELKAESKVPTAEELQPSLDAATDTALATGIPELTQSTEEPVVPNHINSEQSGIEGAEHLLATLDMVANKPEEILAEDFLHHLQGELGVDLADHAALVEPTASIPEPLLSTSAFGRSDDVADGHDSMKRSEPAKAPVETVKTLEDAKIQNTILPVSPSAPSAPVVVAAVAVSAEPLKKRDEKEPIQIVRGGRVITLPPIEAPTTRSKRLQAKPEVQHGTPEPPKREEKLMKPMVQQQQQQQEQHVVHHQVKEIEEMEPEMDGVPGVEDDEDDEDDEGDNSDSEDDPDRLWCICKRPHNNRFMICCDVCEDWFHGKCVHVSKAMGKQMEEKGIEWVCPNCAKKKEQEASSKQTKLQFIPGKPLKLEIASRVSVDQPAQGSAPRPSISPSEKTANFPIVPPDHGMAPVAGVTQCVVCKKEARNSSIYCSDACILLHAQETLTKESKPSPVGQTKPAVVSSEAPKPVTEARVIVFERRTGKVLTGADAPTRSNFKTWLKENPTFEVVHPNNLNTLQIGGKTVTAIQTQGMGKLVKSTQGAQPGVQSKMVYTKVLGSKQTVLAPSNKKLVVLTGGQQRASLEPKTLQLKQPVPAGGAKSPGLRQTTIKIVPQQVKSPVTTPKTPVAKKPEAKNWTPPQQKVVQKTPPAKKSEPEPIRVNVRKTLAESLTTRITSSPDLKLTEEEITELGLNIELELYKYFRDTGAKYKAKYRSLLFNIKDTKNLTLFRKIADRSLTPDAVVRLSPDEMASQELAEWREKETKHQLEMIKKNELDLMAQAKSIVVKTHKGEQIIENEGGMDHVDPKTPVQDIVTALNSHESSQEKDEKDDKATLLPTIDDAKKLKGTDEIRKKKDKEKDKEKNRGGGVRSKDKERAKEKREERSHSRGTSHRSRERSRDRRSTRSKDSKRDKSCRERERDKDKDRDRDKGKDKPKDKDRPRKSRSGRAGHRDYKDKEKKDEERKKEVDKKSDGGLQPEGEKPIEDRLWRHVEEETTSNTLDGNDSDVSDREPSSTVNIKTPDINEEPEREKEPEAQLTGKHVAKGPSQTVWRGFVNMVDVAKFFITAQEVSGHAKDLMEDLPDTVDVVGRISHDTVWDYISKMKKTSSKEILVIRLTAANDEEKIPYITLYSYLNSRSRLGVVGNVSKNIKDFYIMPFSRQSQIPPVLLPLIGPGFEDQRPHLLLGIIVRIKRKRVSTTPSGPIPAKLVKKETEAGNQPQPAASASKEKAKPSIGAHSPSSPPSSPRTLHKGLLLETLKEKQPVTQITLDSLNKAHVGMSRGILDNSIISKIVPELSSKIEISDSPTGAPVVDEADDDGDEPYSPGGIDNEPDDADVVTKSALDDLSASILSPTKNSTELQRKMDELNRQIEEQKQQIQSISSSFLGDATTTTLPGLGLDPPDIADMDEAYSPTDARSFTPPPPGIAKFTQPILDKVSDITIPPNLQEILANVKRQEISKVDPYLPSKPSATFLTSVNSSVYQKPDKYTPTFIKNCPAERAAAIDKPAFENTPSPARETKSTLGSLSELDLIKKAEEQLAEYPAEYAASASLPSVVQSSPAKVPVPFSSPSSTTVPALPATVFPGLQESTPDVPVAFPSPNLMDSGAKKTSCNFASAQPKPPGLEDEELPVFPSTPPTTSPQKFVPKSGIVLSVKRKVCEDGTPLAPVTPVKTPRTKSRWGQGPSE